MAASNAEDSEAGPHAAQLPQTEPKVNTKRRRCGNCDKLLVFSWIIIVGGGVLGLIIGVVPSLDQLFPNPAEQKLLAQFLSSSPSSIPHVKDNIPPACNSKMPSGFLWGASSSAFQVEGSLKSEGRSPSIWDVFAAKPQMVVDGSTADVAADQYKRYYEDIQLMKQQGIKAYRFSISWSRVIPGGTADSPINPRAIAHYVNLTDTLIAAGITPVVTLYHWDLPAALDDESVYGETPGWLNPDMPVHFSRYASEMFKALGGKVKDWITINEPWMICAGGYASLMNAPGRSASPYVCGRVVLAAHARAVSAFRKDKYEGKIGIAINADMVQPLTTVDGKTDDVKAAQRVMESTVGWFLDPIFFGTYPKVMVDRLGSNNMFLLPEEVKFIKGSTDFVAINHFTTRWVVSTPVTANNPMGAITTQFNYKGKPIGELTGAGWLMSVPWGLRSALKWVSSRYQAPEIWITENGVTLAPKNGTDVLTQSVDDTGRIQYHKDYLQALCQSVNVDGVKVKGYFVKTFVDAFEWKAGYSQQYGLVHLNGTGLARVPKKSAEWYKQFIASQS